MAERTNFPPPGDHPPRNYAARDYPPQQRPARDYPPQQERFSNDPSPRDYSPPQEHPRRDSQPPYEYSHVVDRLSYEFARVHPPATVTRCVDAARHGAQDVTGLATPDLVERVARQHLQVLAMAFEERRSPFPA